VPLTETRIAPEELIGGGGATPIMVTGGTVTDALTTGEPLAAPSGRADDFSWPRGAMVNLDPAAPDTAAPDAGATSAKPAQRKSVMDAYAAQTGRQQKPAQRRARPRLTHNPWAYDRPNVSFFGSSGW
jgi:hypothetical protein